MSSKTRLIYLAVWAVVVVAIHLLLGVGPALGRALLIVGLYLLLTWPVRALPLSSFFLLFFVGLLVVSHVTVLFQFLIKGIFLPPSWSNEGTFLDNVFLAPISEEILKLLPLVLLLIRKETRARTAFGATDLMLCGLAIGTGFHLFEDVLVGPIEMPTAGPVLGGLPLIPGVEKQVVRGRPDIVFIGHAAGTAFMGLALGWSRYLKKRWRYVPVLVVLVWMMWCHAMHNGTDAFPREAWVFVTAPLTWLAPWVFLLAVVATVIFEWILLRRGVTSVEQSYKQRLRQVLPGWPSGGLTWLDRWWRWLLCRDLARQIGYARLWLRAQPDDKDTVEVHMVEILPELEKGLAWLAPATGA
jgi:RsiW-degrading membrane proteinase PrsW (M82 family)